MASKPMGFCPAKGCPNRAHGYCPDHQRRKDQRRHEVRRDETHRALYRKERWKRMSEEQRAREPWCWYCLQRGVKRLATCVDHVKPASTHPELFFEPSNHRSSCDPCNDSKGDRTG